MATPTVRVDLRDIERFTGQLEAGLRGGPSGPLAPVFIQWGARARGFWRQRFDKASKGDGTWKPLSKATKEARARRTVERLRAHFASGAIDEATFRKRLPAALRRQRKVLASIADGTGKFAILRDTGTLFAALTPTFQSLPGAFQKDILGGIRVGYGGPHRHPTADGESKGVTATVADIAMFHDRGLGVPQREIIVMPTQQVIAAMAADLARGLRSIDKGSG